MVDSESLRVVTPEGYKFTSNVFSSVNAEHYPLRARLADVGRKAAYFTVGGGFVVGVLAAPVNQGLMALGIVTGVVAIVAGRAFETYLDRQVPVSR